MNLTKHEIGTVVVFENADGLLDVTAGKEYTIVGYDDIGDEYFIDDAGDKDFAAASGHNGTGAGDGDYKIVKTA